MKLKLNFPVPVFVAAQVSFEQPVVMCVTLIEQKPAHNINKRGQNKIELKKKKEKKLENLMML
jgi:hypothetical protein